MTKKDKKRRIPADQFLVWLKLDKRDRPRLGKAAGGLSLPMNEFARRAVLEALSRSEAGEEPFPGHSAQTS